MTPKALSREIKFRAWNDSKKDWEGNFSISRIGSFLRLGIPQSTEGIHVMQFTGLHDKNGKEIYEGDIIHFVGNKMEADSNWHDDPRTDAVVWDDKESAFYIGEINYLGYLVSAFECEIIGNICESPELLTKENN